MNHPDPLRDRSAPTPGPPSNDLERLRLPTEPLSPATSVIDVAQRFLDPACAGLLSLPVVDALRRPLGMISRYQLMSVFLQPFGREIFGRRPITELMNADALMLATTTPLEHAARLVALHIASPITEDFVLLDGDGAYDGTGLVLDVLHAVESRLAERGNELERAHARLKSSQMQMVQAEKMASLGQMVAGLVHEINTPLGYVRNNVEMTRAALSDVATLVAAQEEAIASLRDARRAHAGSGSAVQRLDAARACVDSNAIGDLLGLLDDCAHGIGQIGELVANLKDFSRLDQAGMQQADLNHLVSSAIRIVGHVLRSRGIEVVRREGALPPVECAPAQVNQVLLNLISNAAQAIEHSRGRIVVATQALDRRVMVLVEDNGKGIPADALPRIFDPFFTTKPVGQGTGMGLAIAHQIIAQHGGAIRVSSKPGVGTRFLVVLPSARASGDAA